MLSSTDAKVCWDSMASPTARKVALALTNQQHTVSHQTISRWAKNEGWGCGATGGKEDPKEHPLAQALAAWGAVGDSDELKDLRKRLATTEAQLSEAKTRAEAAERRARAAETRARVTETQATAAK